MFIDIKSIQNKLKHSRVNLIETTTATTSITTKMTTAVKSTTSSMTPTTQMKTLTSTMRSKKLFIHENSRTMLYINRHEILT